GSVHADRGRSDDALAAYEEALALARNSYHRPLDIGRAWLRVGEGRAQVGDRAGALRAFDQALASLSELRQGASAFQGIGRLLASAGRRDEALDYYRRAMEQARTFMSWPSRREVVMDLARFHAEGGDVDAALDILDDGLEASESAREVLSNPNLQTPQGVSDQPFHDLKVELLMEKHRRSPSEGFSRAAFAASERSRARGLLGALPPGAGRRPSDPALVTERAALIRRLEDLASAERADPGPGPSARSREIERADVLNRLAEIEAAARVARRGAASEDGALRPLTLDAVERDVLDDDTLLLHYDLGEEVSYVWSVTADGFDVARLPARRDIEEAVRDLYAAVTARANREDFESERRESQRIAAADLRVPAAAARVRQMVLDPVARHLGKKRLVIAADGILQSIPFAILPSPRDPVCATPLVVDHDIVGVPSVSVWAQLRRRARVKDAPPKTLAVLADPVFDRNDPRFGNRPATPNGRPLERDVLRAVLRFSADPQARNLDRLPATLREARDIARRVRPEQRLVALGFQARRELATSGVLGGYRILHFASHAFLSSDFPELSGVVLSLVDADGEPLVGFLSVADIRGLELSADLVVLSACRTALGRDARGEGLLSLARGFLMAGASSVVASVWSPRDQPTADLMGRFYRALLVDDLTPAAALRRAQVSMYREGILPYYWGGFVVLGHG
ncbi:MAG: CHAT domain-containing tetratricopeptide repeat protein, partial [Acidobacteriota bacterium]